MLNYRHVSGENEASPVGIKYWLVRGTLVVCTSILIGSWSVCAYGLHREGATEEVRYHLLYRHFGITFPVAVAMILPSIVLFEDKSPRTLPRKPQRGHFSQTTTGVDHNR